MGVLIIIVAAIAAIFVGIFGYSFLKAEKSNVDVCEVNCFWIGWIGVVSCSLIANIIDCIAKYL